MTEFLTVEVLVGGVIVATLAPIYLLYLDRIGDAMKKNNSPPKV